MTATTARSNAPGASTDLTADASGGFSHGQILTIISGLMLGMFLAALDQTVVSTAIRTIADDLQGYSLQAWATTAFLITSTLSTPLYGKLSDLYGRKGFYLLAIGIFVVGSMLCGTATSMYQLAAYRAFQGLGAGGLMSLAFAIVGDIVAPRERAKYQAYFMAVFGSSSVLGPVIGGLLAGQDTLLWTSGWRWIFYVNVPIGVAAFAVVMRNLHVPHTRRDHRVDWPGALLLTLTLVPLLIVAEQGREWGWTSGSAVLCYVLAGLGLVGFIVDQHLYGDDALLPLRLFTGRTFAVGVTASAIVGVGMFGGLALLPQYLQVVKGSSPTVAGLQMIPLVAGIILAGMVAGRVIGRTGRYRVLPIIGTTFMVIAMLGFWRISADSSLYWIMGAMLLFGSGLGLNMQPVILAVQNAVSPREIGVATSSVTFFRQIGGTLGTAVFLSILFSTLAGKISTEVTKAAGTAAYRQALADNPDQAKLLASGASKALSDTSFISTLDPVLARPFKVGFTDSMDTIFLIAAGVLVVGFVITLLLPELPLRTGSALQARAAETAGDTVGATDVDDTAPEEARGSALAAATSSQPVVTGAQVGSGSESGVTHEHPHPAHRADRHAAHRH